MTHRDTIGVVWGVAAQVSSGDAAACLAAWLLGVVQRGVWGVA